MYVPSRIGRLLKLECEGYGADELRLIAQLEEWAIDNIYTADDLAYVDDDLDTLILFAESRAEALATEGWMSPELGDRTKELEKARNEVRFLKRLKENLASSASKSRRGRNNGLLMREADGFVSYEVFFDPTASSTQGVLSIVGLVAEILVVVPLGLFVGGLASLPREAASSRQQ